MGVDARRMEHATPTAPPTRPEVPVARADERDEPHLARLSALRPEIETVLGGTAHTNKLNNTTPKTHTQLIKTLIT